jgi:hypothetical protein
MDAVTYPDEDVVRCVEKSVVPLQVPFDSQPLASEFNIKWTPALFIVDEDGKIRQGSLGFFNADRFVPWILLGRAKSHFARGEFDMALTFMEGILKEHGESPFAPEAVYYQGVTRYKSTDEAGHLKEGYKKLAQEYPSSVWTMKAYPYSLL